MAAIADDGEAFSVPAGLPFGVVRAEGRGRCAVATRDVAVGEVVLREGAVAAMLLGAYESSRCSLCMRRLRSRPTEHACGECGLQTYCSAACKARAAPLHSAECDAFVAVARAARASGADPDLLRVVARLLWTRYGEAGSSAGGADAEPAAGGAGHAPQACVVGGPHRWGHVAALQAHQSEGEGSAAWRDSVRRGLQKLKRKLPKAEGVVDEGVFLAAAVNTNAHGILSGGGSGHAVGLGLFPLVALLNHSCDPNMAFEYQFAAAAPHMAVRALRPVGAGQELCVSYVDLLESTPRRRQRLQREKGFRCVCERCALADEHSDPERQPALLLSDAQVADAIAAGRAPADAPRGTVMRAVDRMLSALLCPCGGVLLKEGAKEGWRCSRCAAAVDEGTVAAAESYWNAFSLAADRAASGDARLAADFCWAALALMDDAWRRVRGPHGGEAEAGAIRGTLEGKAEELAGCARAALRGVLPHPLHRSIVALLPVAAAHASGAAEAALRRRLAAVKAALGIPESAESPESPESAESAERTEGAESPQGGRGGAVQE